MSTTSTDRDAKTVAIRCLELMSSGSLSDFEELFHPDAYNREAEDDEPPASRGRGPAAFYATAIWLRDAFGDIRWEIHDAIAEGDLVAVHSHYVNAPGERGQAIVDLFRVRGGKIVEHWDVIQDVPATSANDNGMF
jgi:predicted SnoaL-like aldol condensation-catalyzing enzyme